MGLLRQPTSDITKGVIWKQLLAFFFPCGSAPFSSSSTIRWTPWWWAGSWARWPWPPWAPPPSSST
ncbi:hypothetical protein M5E87_07740 [Flavonifractor plautii]|nr:hypothetical protein M5E87_07740 [Flavonifractor plautii]